MRRVLLRGLFFGLLFVWCARLSAQPKTIRESQSKELNQPSEPITFEGAPGAAQVVSLEVLSLTGVRFPSVSISYERFFANYFAGYVTAGIPLNTRVHSTYSGGDFDGYNLGFGLKAFLTNQEYSRQRFFIEFASSFYRNPTSAGAYVVQARSNLYQYEDVIILRRREQWEFYVGIQAMSRYGLTLDATLGISNGKRGVFEERGRDFLSTAQENLFNFGIAPNTWDNFTVGNVGLRIGYAF
jgi:hypothetical protein